MELKKLLYQQALRLKRVRAQREESPFIFRASELGDCPRVIFLRKKNVPSVKGFKNIWDEARVEMLFADGRMHQAALTNYAHQAPGVHVTNVEEDRILLEKSPAGRTFLITGHPDALIYVVKTAERIVWEIKGLSRFTCQRLKEGDIDSLKREYGTAIPQARCYTKMFDTNGAIIHVKNKDTSEIYEFQLPRNDDSFKRTVSRMGEICDAVCEGQEISCAYEKGSNECRFCPYPDQCGNK